ncbi:nitrous oxide reductase family maturation protein NosD [Desertivirga arenae]|uniref:nitrous oxide reductase family maturation protein NosD n=1 Tax=Desertivirga arenae TaxID=2810309 RepID=UPI001A96CA8E|nr:nitrous oxide reductase family maturation protein NosD [Pedobacter sp. SYSU D00823]
MKASILYLFFIILSSLTSANTITVAQKGRINNLGKAIALAKNGDTIIVQKGHYPSYNTIINKSLTILGKDFPVLDAGFREEVITILARQVKLDGFVIKNSKVGSLRDYAGIRIHRTEQVHISNNKLMNNFFGIYISDSKHVSIYNNSTQGTNSAQNSGNGIHMWQCQDIKINNNYSSGHRDGIYFEFVKKSTISNNRSVKNLRYGLHFMFSDDNLYRGNTFKNNGSGVAVMYSKRIRMYNNLFLENWGSSIYGLLLKDISNCDIKHNRFIRNTTGIYMEGCQGINACNNQFLNNGWAMRVLANCVNGEFTRNNFTANSFDVTTNGSLNLNNFNNNYWDKYEGYDLNKNGIGDIPYHPISLYAQLIEQIPQSVMLMRSFMVNLLDKVERAIPSLTPESVKDNHPKMKPWEI